MLIQKIKGVSVSEWMLLGAVMITILIRYFPAIRSLFKKKEPGNYHHLRDYDMNMKDRYYQERKGITNMEDVVDAAIKPGNEKSLPPAKVNDAFPLRRRSKS